MLESQKLNVNIFRHNTSYIMNHQNEARKKGLMSKYLKCMRTSLELLACKHGRLRKQVKKTDKLKPKYLLWKSRTTLYSSP